MTEPLISIIVVSWNTRDLLKRCLESLYSTLPPLAFEAIVVDNSSDDGSPEMVSEEFAEAVLIQSGANLGFSGGNNLGLRAARGRYAMLLNSDAELTEGSAARMLEFMESHPDVGMAGPKLISPDGTLQINGQKLPTVVREILGVLRVPRFIPAVGRLGWGRDDFDVNADVDSLAGACMLVRREILETVGLLDEHFFMYFEDVDWCRRIRSAGWRICYLGEISIVHGWAQSAAKQGLVRSHEMLHRSRCLYFRKYHGLIGGGLVCIVSAMVNWAFALRYRER